MKNFFKRREHKPPMTVPNIPRAQDDRQPIDSELVRTGSNLFAASCPAWHSADDHAIALLQWMQGPGGRVGEIPASELMKAHSEMCAEYFWEQMAWIPVAKAFRRLIDDTTHHYASRNSRRIVVYRIPQQIIEKEAR